MHRNVPANPNFNNFTPCVKICWAQKVLEGAHFLHISVERSPLANFLLSHDVAHVAWVWGRSRLLCWHVLVAVLCFGSFLFYLFFVLILWVSFIHECLWQIFLSLAGVFLLWFQHAAQLHLMDLHIKRSGGRHKGGGLAACTALRETREKQMNLFHCYVLMKELDVLKK